MPTKTTWGGRRKGAGRKAAAGPPRKNYSFYLTDGEHKKLAQDLKQWRTRNAAQLSQGTIKLLHAWQPVCGNLQVNNMFSLISSLCSAAPKEKTKKILFYCRDYYNPRNEIAITNQKCPQCHTGLVVLRRDRNGQQYECCTNSRFWKSGSQSCDYQHYQAT